VVSGLRAAFNLPAELRANWIFQVCEGEDSVPHIRAVRKWIIVMGIAPLFGLLTPFEVFFRGWVAGLIHVSFALVLSLLMLNLLLVWFRKIPFSCAYFPGKTSMAVMALIYLAGFVFYAGAMAAIEARLMQAPAKLVIFYALALAALWGLSLLEKRELNVDQVLIYEDQPDPIVRTLEIG
jgi:hypothetical protein